MSTAGYDVVLQINEEIINRFLQISHCMGLFRAINGTYTLPLGDVPESLREFINIGYEITLVDNPTLDFRDDLSIFLRTRGQVKFTVLGGIEFELEVQFRIAITPYYDQSTRRFSMEIVEAALEDIEIEDIYHLPRNVIDKLNEICAIAMAEYMNENTVSTQLGPVLFALNLPFMPPGEENRLTIGMGNVKVLNPSVLSAAINLLGYTGGNVDDLTDFTDGNHVGVGVSENAMHRIYNFWWNRTTHPKSLTITDDHDFDLSAYDEWLEGLAEWSTALLTLGIVGEDIEMERIWATYGANARFSRFDFDMKPGNTVNFSGSITLDIWLRFLVRVTTTTRILFWFLDPETRELELFNLHARGLRINIESGEGRVYLDDENRLMVDLSDLDIDIPLDWEIPEFLLDYIVDWAVNMLLDNMPPIVLAPGVVSGTIPSTEITVGLGLGKLEINEEQAIVAANVTTSGPETYAPYIANTDSLEVHLRNCQYGRLIKREHREYYCDLEEALRTYDGCYYCLPEHHHD